MTTNRTKLIAIFLFAIPLTFVGAFRAAPIGQLAPNTEDAAAVYRAKCMACHTPKATKFYDPAKSDEEHIAVILAGKKGEKPPYMPGYKEKGMTEEQAKELAELMKSLRTAN
ncbi:MAG: cytochrome c [Pyrinomonadaceae bacterium]